MLNHETTSAPGHAPIGISEGPPLPDTLAAIRKQTADVRSGLDELGRSIREMRAERDRYRDALRAVMVAWMADADPYTRLSRIFGIANAATRPSGVPTPCAGADASGPSGGFVRA